VLRFSSPSFALAVLVPVLVLAACSPAGPTSLPPSETSPDASPLPEASPDGATACDPNLGDACGNSNASCTDTWSSALARACQGAEGITLGQSVAVDCGDFYSFSPPFVDTSTTEYFDVTTGALIGIVFSSAETIPSMTSCWGAVPAACPHPTPVTCPPSSPTTPDASDGSSPTVQLDGSLPDSAVADGANGPDSALPGVACSIGSDAGTTVGEYECYPASFIPSGACTADTACSFCSLPCGPQIPREFYSCSCAGGGWQCVLVDQDESACPIPSDASAE
jgi:hypothetical protein